MHFCLYLKGIYLIEHGVTMKNVFVLMSSYNGKLYIEEQIESILSQRGVDVTLFVRDDGSNDDTLSILNKFQSKYKNVVVTADNNLGAALSFMDLLFRIPDNSEFYALADQDDIWEPDKLVTAIEMLENNQNALLYSSNQKIVDSNNLYRQDRYSFIPPLDVFNIIDKNYLSGCTMVLKKKLLLKIRENRPSDDIITSRMHDTWIAAVAACFGEIIYDDKAFIRYRQHDNNVVGIRKVALNKRFIVKIKGRNSYHKDFADELIKLFRYDTSYINEKSMMALNYYHNCNTLVGKIQLLTSSYFRTIYFRNKAQFAFKLLMFE